MAIDNDDAFFALLCARLHIEDITLIITVPDDEIRRRCTGFIWHISLEKRGVKKQQAEHSSYRGGNVRNQLPLTWSDTDLRLIQNKIDSLHNFQNK